MLKNDLFNLLQPILLNFATSDDFTSFMARIFGVNAQTETLRQQWLNQSWTMPTVEVVSSSDINGASGAYAAQTDTIYLSQELLNSNNTTLIARVLLEEYGHSIDAFLNITDTPGDEGEYFALVTLGQAISDEDFIRIKTQNDSAVVTLDGIQLQIEQAANTGTVTNTSTITIDSSFDTYYYNYGTFYNGFNSGSTGNIINGSSSTGSLYNRYNGYYGTANLYNGFNSGSTGNIINGYSGTGYGVLFNGHYGTANLYNGYSGTGYLFNGHSGYGFLYNAYYNTTAFVYNGYNSGSTGYLYNGYNSGSTGTLINGTNSGSTGYLINGTNSGSTGYLINGTSSGSTGHLYNGSYYGVGYLYNGHSGTGYLYNGYNSGSVGYLYNGWDYSTSYLYNGYNNGSVGYLYNGYSGTGYLYNGYNSSSVGYLYNGGNGGVGRLYNGGASTGYLYNWAFGTIINSFGSQIINNSLGYILNDGLINNQGTFTNNGTLAGIGKFQGALTVGAGVIAPGGNWNSYYTDTNGAFTVQGTLTQSGSAVLRLSLTSPSSYDVLRVTDNANFSGGSIQLTGFDTFKNSNFASGTTNLVLIDGDSDNNGIGTLAIASSILSSLSNTVNAYDSFTASSTTDFSVLLSSNDLILRIVRNLAPTNLGLSATSVNENVAALTTIGTFSTTDPDTGNTFTYSLVSGAGDTDNALFNIVNSNQLQLNVSPNYETQNTYSIRVRTTDQGGLSFERSLTISVNDLNEAPSFTGNATLTSIPEDTINPVGQSIGSLFNGLVSDPDGGASLKGVAVYSDPADSATQGRWQYSVNNGSNWYDVGFNGDLAFALSTTALIRFVPVANYNGTPPGLTVRALDNTYSGNLTSTGGVHFIVNTQTVGGASPISANTATINATVTPVNDAPAMNGAIAAQTAMEEVPFSFTIPASIFADPDGDTLTYAATLADDRPLPGWITFNPATRTFSGTPDDADLATLNIKVTATDPAGISVFQVFQVAVEPTDDPTVIIAPAQQTIDEDTSLVFSSATGNAITLTDVDAGDSLLQVSLLVSSYSGSGGSGFLYLGDTSGLTYVSEDSRSFRGTLAAINAALEGLTFYPSSNDNGTVNLQVMVSNPDTLSASSKNIPIQVNPINDAPQLQLGIAPTVNEDEPFSFSFFQAYDPDDRYGTIPLTYGATLADGSDLPSWISFDPATRTFSGTPSSQHVGTLDIQVTVSDGQATSSEIFTLTIANTNDAPVAVNDAFTTNQGQAIVISTATLLSNDRDEDPGDALSLINVTQPSRGTLLNNGNGTYTYTPNAGYFGTDRFTYTISDNQGSTTTATVDLTINQTLNLIRGTSGSDRLTGTNQNDWILGLEGNDLMRGNAGSDRLEGDAGNDTLDGGVGDDNLIGGAGNDTYYVDTVGDTLTEELNAGTDAVIASLNWTLGNNLENLTLAGTGAINGTGNALNNTLTGNAAANILSGEDGHDNLRGLAGNDILNGGAGNDALDGGIGDDSLIGGTGNDTYYIDSSGDTITEDVDAGMDTVRSSVSWSLGDNLENLVLTGTEAINGSGNALNNAITGNTAANILSGGSGNDTLRGLDGNDSLIGGAGNDILEGGIGDDSLIGGAGNDTYYVDSSGDILTEDFNAGTDAVIASLNWTLGDNLENLTLTGTGAINGTGNALNNSITGNTAANILSGGGGNDSLKGNSGDDVLLGGAGKDTLVGDSGDDLLSGGNDQDRLTGGIGRDRFDLSGSRSSTFDILTDFNRADDLILISKTEFGLSQSIGTLDSTTFVQGSSATQLSDRFIYNQSTGALFFDEDGSGGIAKVQIAQLSNKPVLDSSAIVVIA